MLRLSFAFACVAILAAAPSQAGTVAPGEASIRAGNHDCPRCTLAGLDLSNQCVKHGNLEGADFTGTKLVMACMSFSNFRAARFNGADLSGANLSGSTLTDADFAGAVFSATQARGTDFSRAKNLTQAQLGGVCGDAKTRAPAGLTVPRCD